MKFGEELENNIYEPWRSEYVAYNDIKLDMRERQDDHKWNDMDEDDFETALRSEADKVDNFITRKQREIESRLAYCERSLTQQSKNITPSVARNLFDTTDDTLTEILMDLNDLSKFTRYNFLAIQKLIKKHDKYTDYNNQLLFVDIIRSKSLDRQRFDVALVKISTLHDICSLRGEVRQGNSAAGLDQNDFERATAKYWIHPDNVTELKAILLFHLPVLVFNPEKPIEPADSAISSVYFDNPNFDLYQGRLQRDESAEAIRFRWYGPMESNSIFIERKTHHAPWLNGASVKDRFRLNADKVDDFIDGTYTAEKYADDLKAKGATEDVVKANYFIASGVQKSISEKSLEPIMRVFYNRTAFQIPGDQRLRLSLDTDMTFVREDGKAERRKGSWRRPDMGINYPFDNLNPAEVYKFPYAVLETKLQTHLGQEPPQWLTRLLESRLVYEVPRFSKFLQGAAFFWNPRLPLLPWWLSQLELDIRNAKIPTGNFSGLSRSKSLKPLIDGKYRMGYLESQLERSSTLKRVESTTKKPLLTRNASKRSSKMPRSAETGNLGRKLTLTRSTTPGTMNGASNSPVSQTGSHRSGNPFDDPIWSQHDISYDTPSGLAGRNSVAGSGSTSRLRSMTPDGRRTNDLFDTSSTEFLMGGKQTPRSSYAQNEKSGKISDSRLNSYFDENLEAGNGGYDSEEEAAERKRIKKEKKKALKEKEGGATIEPKIYFANERTFIQWLHFAALLLSVALTLMNFGDHINKIVGAVFFGIAFIFSIYAIAFYRWRAWRITNKPHLRYDDMFGPVFLCILLLGALITNFALRYNSPPENTTFLGVGNSTSTASVAAATPAAPAATDVGL
ncbi:VTC domain-containing protein [Mucor mucedo]|uniref:VTC domain-containing protein n=1 Tax=Mucor mucedo TaxID=29922 RepID=UPI00221EECFF|nr:VTC domain-containing protein [Mucor mucedo]KAI7892896.1 VTC domain-containing protein [Mucor mucedo]